MSSKKKPLLLLLLLLIIAAIAGWFYMGQKNGADDNLSSKEQIEDALDSHAGHDHSGHDHGDHENTATSASTAPVGEKGTVYNLPIKPTLGRRGLGDPNAPVQIQEFFSLTCNHCADFHNTTFQDIKTNYVDTGKVYFIFEEFPLNGPALYGSMIARCLPEERYSGFIDLLLKNQEAWAFGGDFKNSLKQNAKLAGMSDEEFDTCFNNKTLQGEIALNVKEASEAWKVSSTPSFVLNNGELIIRGGKSYADFSKAIDALLADKE